MTVEQRGSTRRQRLLAEGILGHFQKPAAVAFPYEIVIPAFRDKDSGWRATTGPSLITLRTELYTVDPNEEYRERAAKEASKRFPVIRKVVTAQRLPEEANGPRIVVTLPTVSTANALARDTFKGLPTAGIELIQTPEKKPIPVTDYLQSLMSGKLSVGSGLIYVHDIADHWLGAASIEQREFEVFQALCEDIGAIGETFGRQKQIRYMTSLASAFDDFTDKIWVSLENKDGPTSISLIDSCLSKLDYYVRDVSSRSKAIEIGMDSRSSRSRREENEEYYDAVLTRLRQEPWTPRIAA